MISLTNDVVTENVIPMDKNLNHNVISFGEVDVRSENRISFSPFTEGIKLNFRLFSSSKLCFKSNNILIFIVVMTQVVY
jgi:hypothetical protein